MQPTVTEEEIGVQGFVPVTGLAPGRDNTSNNTHWKLCWLSKNGLPTVMNAYSRAQTYMVYYVDRHWTKRLWFYLIVFQVWKPQWKRVLVHGQLATQHAQVFSSACAAVAETTFALCLETGICNYCSHTFQRPSPGQPCHQEEVGTPRPLLPVIVHPRRGKGGNSWMRCMCRVLQSNPWRHGTEYGSQTAYFTWIPTENLYTWQRSIGHTLKLNWFDYRQCLAIHTVIQFEQNTIAICGDIKWVCSKLVQAFIAHVPVCTQLLTISSTTTCMHRHFLPQTIRHTCKAHCYPF